MREIDAYMEFHLVPKKKGISLLMATRGTWSGTYATNITINVLKERQCLQFGSFCCLILIKEIAKITHKINNVTPYSIAATKSWYETNQKLDCVRQQTG